MNTLHTALNFNFAAGESVRIAQADRGAQEALARQLSQGGAAAPFVVGSTVTARYRYKVAEDGSLLPLQTQITTELPEATPRRTGRRPEQPAAEGGFARHHGLADLARPQVSLSPAEELAVFAANENATRSFRQARSGEQQAPLPGVIASPNRKFLTPASDENGRPVEIELLTPHAATEAGAAADSASRHRVQYAVAALYARNNDVVYNVTPISQLAA
ncbi:MAG: hypothetical protein SFW64_02150 [Alphaproteobacteria bacterium]|nr:hypothetical protein [Alphaproteobacteria bacterium]